MAVCNPGSDPWGYHPQTEKPKKGKQCHSGGSTVFAQGKPGIQF